MTCYTTTFSVFVLRNDGLPFQKRNPGEKDAFGGNPEGSLSCDSEAATRLAPRFNFAFIIAFLKDKMSSKKGEPICVFKCVGVSDKVLKFTAENLQQCREKLRIRVALDMKYKDVILRQCVDGDGYHSACRKNFFAIPKKYIHKYKDFMRLPVAITILHFSGKVNSVHLNYFQKMKSLRRHSLL